MPPKPSRPSDKLLRPSDSKPKSGKPELFKDRRTHKIELRQKITRLKEEISELKGIETSDEAKQAEIQEAISELKIKLKYCDMEKDAIENFNHTQFLNNLQASDQSKDRFSDESTGNTRFFAHLKGSASSKTEDSKTEDSKTEDSKTEAGETKQTDPFLQVNQPDDALSPEVEGEPKKTSESPETSKTKEPSPQVYIPPNTIV